MATASTAQPKWINDPIAAAIGRIVMLEEEIEREKARIRQLEDKLLQLLQPRQLMTEKELATLLRVSLRTLKRWREEKPIARIPFVLMEGGDIRYRAEAVEAYLKSRERGNSPTQAAKKGSAI